MEKFYKYFIINEMFRTYHLFEFIMILITLFLLIPITLHLGMIAIEILAYAV